MNNTADRIFGTPSQADKSKAQNLESGNKEDAPYFHKRMVRSRSRRAGGSHVVGILNSSAKKQALENKLSSPEATHTHLDQFLRAQIGSA